MSSHGPRAALVAASLFALAACRTSPTQVLVVIDSDSPRDRALTVSATFYPEGNARPSAPASRWTFGDAFATRFPSTFTVVPTSAGPRDATVLLELDAELAANSAGARVERFRRTARFRFVPGASSVLRLFLRRACAAPAVGCTSVTDAQCTTAVRCEEQSLTCGDDGACVTPDVVPAPQTDAGLDAATDRVSVDATADSASDSAAIVDAAPDARPSPCSVDIRREDLGGYDAGAVINRALAPHTRETTEVFSFVTGPAGSSLSIEATGPAMNVDIARVLWISARECGEPTDPYALAGPAVHPVIDAMIGPGPGGILLLGANARYFVHHRTLSDFAARTESCAVGMDCSGTLQLRW